VAAADALPAPPPLVAGLAFATIAAAAALGLGAAQARLFGQPLLEGLVLALLLGVAGRNLLPPERIAVLTPGAGFASKQLLEVGVALLGAGLAAGEVLRAGPRLLGLIVGGVGLAIGVGYGIGRGLGLGTKLALLVAVGNAVCGNSAIAALAPVIRAEKRDVASAVGLTALLGLGLVLGLPLLVAPLGLSDYQYGVLAGMSVYAVPQVVAAAFPVSQLSGEVATLVKLGRVLMLGPIVLAVGLLFRGTARGGLLPYLPWFVLTFIGLAALRSVGLLPEAVAGPTREVSRLLTTVAIAGLGFGVDVGAAGRVGPRVAAAAAASLLFLGILTVTVLRLGGLG
jgi:uncharacterized integral membrane protein (TIGR00698 family)